MQDEEAMSTGKRMIGDNLWQVIAGPPIDVPRSDGRSFLFPFLHVLGLPIQVSYFLQCTSSTCGFLFGFPISCSTFLRYSGFLFPLPLYMYSGFLFPFLLCSEFLFPIVPAGSGSYLYSSTDTHCYY